MRLISESEVRQMVDFDAMIAASRDAFVLLSTGQAEIPLRTEVPLAHGGQFWVMPGLIADKFMGFKLIANKPDPDEESGLKTTSIILILDAETVAPIGILSSDWFTDFRTAAGLAAATQDLSLPDARTLAVFGAGKLAEPTIRLLCRVRDFERVIVVSRTRSRLERLTNLLRSDPAMQGIRIDDDVSPDEAAGAADVVATVTSASSPVFDGRVVRPGTHINIAGAYRADWREIDDAVAGQAAFYLDSAKTCLARAGDIVIPLQSGVLSKERIRGEIGELFAGEAPGRGSSDEITVFKSLGNAVQDLHLGAALLQANPKAGLGFDLDA